MTKTLTAAVLAVTLAFAAMPAAASAQQPDAGDGFQFPPQQPAAADPAPVNPAVKSLDSGRLMIVVGSTRNFAYHIGDLIPVTIVVSADKNVHVNLDAIKGKTLSAEPSDFELADAPVIVKEERGGKTVYRIQLLLRSWVIKPVLVLNCDFHYATEMLPNGSTPNWKPVTTPDYVVETSNTATDAAKALLPGDMELKHSAKPVLVQPLKLAGYLAISLLPAYLLILLWRRVRPARKLTTAEMAWTEFDAILEEAKSTGGRLSYEHLFRIASTLRNYLKIDAVPTSEVAIPLEQFFSLYDNKMELMTVTVSALSKLDRGLFSPVELTESEELVLVKEIEQIVPRPE